MNKESLSSEETIFPSKGELMVLGWLTCLSIVNAFRQNGKLWSKSFSDNNNKRKREPKRTNNPSVTIEGIYSCCS